MSWGRPRTRPPPPLVQTGHIPAPSGVNLVDTPSQLAAEDCVLLRNMLRDQRGLRTKSGYRAWVTGTAEATRSILGFRGSTIAKDKLFAASTSGIWDCTASTATPALDHTFGTASGTSGYGRLIAFTNAAGAHFGLYVDEQNGYHVYTESTDTWAKIAQGGGGTEINGVDPGTFVHVVSHKNRVWFTQRDTQTAWYLATNALYGAATAFHFGAQFRSGGFLVGLWSWTVDGGAGVDDYLVAISSGGDLVIYQGTDPSAAATWALRGVWNVGAVPAGRRLATDRGGDLLVLSYLGALPLSRVLGGASIQDVDLYATRKINPVLGQLMTERGGSLGWEITVHPEDKTLLVLTPTPAGESPEQWAMVLAARGWSQLIGTPMTCAEAWKGKLYFGTANGVSINDGDVDNAGISDSTNATAIDWMLITSSQNLGNAQEKQLQQVRPLFLTDGTLPQYAVEARYQFSVAEPAAVQYVASSGSTWVWGASAWGIGVWGSGVGTAGEWRGAAGIGSNVAIALRGASKARTTLVGFDVQFTQGGA